MRADDYLIAAWKIGAPNADISRGFPTGFWPDVARAAVELALARDVTAPLSFRPTRCESGSGFEPTPKVKGIDLSKLEFKL